MAISAKAKADLVKVAVPAWPRRDDGQTKSTAELTAEEARAQRAFACDLLREWLPDAGELARAEAQIRATAPTTLYAADGRCHNAEPGTFGHECGKPAKWLGGKPSLDKPGGIFWSGYCDDCMGNGSEARTAKFWALAVPLEVR